MRYHFFSESFIVRQQGRGGLLIIGQGPERRLRKLQLFYKRPFFAAQT